MLSLLIDYDSTTNLALTFFSRYTQPQTKMFQNEYIFLKLLRTSH